MKEIKKEIVRTEYEYIYVANDGTEFRSEEECRNYEESARGMLFAKYRKLVVESMSEEDLFGHGSCDNLYNIVKVETQTDADLLLQIVLFENRYLQEDEYKDRLDTFMSRINRALFEQDFLFVARGYEDDSFWIDGTKNELIESLRKIGEPKSE